MLNSLCYPVTQVIPAKPFFCNIFINNHILHYLVLIQLHSFLKFMYYYPVSFYYSFQFVLCIIDMYLGFVRVGKKLLLTTEALLRQV